jgi:hypothetical protein
MDVGQPMKFPLFTLGVISAAAFLGPPLRLKIIRGALGSILEMKP